MHVRYINRRHCQLLDLWPSSRRRQHNSIGHLMQPLFSSGLELCLNAVASCTCSYWRSISRMLTARLGVLRTCLLCLSAHYSRCYLYGSCVNCCKGQLPYICPCQVCPKLCTLIDAIFPWLSICMPATKTMQTSLRHGAAGLSESPGSLPFKPV